jgi:hypothetical protein
MKAIQVGLLGIGDHLDLRPDQRLGAASASRWSLTSIPPAPSPPHDLLLVALQDVEHTAADGADAQQADLDCFHREVRFL